MNSVVRKAVRKGILAKNEAETFASRALQIVDEFYPIEPLRTESLREGIRLDHSTYDMFYFVLARRTGATLLTVDRKLAALCEANGVDTVYEIEFPEA